MSQFHCDSILINWGNWFQFGVYLLSKIKHFRDRELGFEVKGNCVVVIFLWGCVTLFWRFVQPMWEIFLSWGRDLSVELFINMVVNSKILGSEFWFKSWPKKSFFLQMASSILSEISVGMIFSGNSMSNCFITPIVVFSNRIQIH